MSTASISVLASMFVGIAGIAGGVWVARGQWVHSEKLARRERTQSRRGDANIEVLTAVRRFTHTYQFECRWFTSPEDEPPSPLEGDALYRIDALLAAYGTKRMRAGLKAWSDVCVSFRDAVDDARQQQPGGGPYPTQEMLKVIAAVVTSEGALQAIARGDLEAEEADDGR